VSTCPEPAETPHDVLGLVGTMAILGAALRTGLLAAIVAKPASVSDLAGRMGYDRRALERVLAVLVTAGLVRRESDRFEATPPLRTAWPLMAQEGELASRMVHFLQTGATAFGRGQTPARAEAYRGAVPALARLFEPLADRLAERLGPDPRPVLDMGCGTGVWGLAMARQHPETQVTGLDSGPVLDAFGERAGRLGMADRIRRVAGDYHQAALPPRSFGRVVLANVLHLESPDRARTLVHRAAAALQPGGTLVIVDVLAGEEIDTFQAAYEAFLGLRVADGKVHPWRDVAGWMAEVGFESPERMTLEEGSGIGALIGRRIDSLGTPLVSLDDTETFGGKGAALGAVARLGLPVPPGFGLSVDEVSRLAAGDPAARKGLERALASLGRPLAVRSSAVGEDGADASFAGQHQTVLGVESDDDVVDALRTVHASAAGEAALAYRQKMGIPGKPRVAIVIQEMVDADSAGVMFTRDPVHGTDVRVVEAAWGLGEAVVAGLVTPDQYRIARGGAVLERIAGDKDLAVRLRPGGGTEERAVPAAEAGALCLTDGQLAALGRLADECELAFDRPQDVEWAFAGGRVYLLQSRAVTTG